MKKAIGITLMWITPMAANATSDPISEAITEINRAKTQWVLDQIGKGEKSPEPTTKATRKLKECIKPKNLIDDEVRKCMEGTIEKNW